MPCPYGRGVIREVALVADTAAVGKGRRADALRSIWCVVAVSRCKKARWDRSNRVVVVEAHSMILEGLMVSSLLLRHRLIEASLLLFLLVFPNVRVFARQETKPLALEPGDLELVISGARDDFPDRPSQPFHPRKIKVTLINHS